MADSITVTKKGKIITITAIDVDLPYSSLAPCGEESAPLLVHSISFRAGSGADIMVISEGDINGPNLFNEKCAAGISTTVYFDGMELHPCIDFSDCTLTTGHEVIIRLV